MNKILKNMAFGVAVVAGASGLSTVAAAQSRAPATAANNVASVNVDAAVQTSAAFTAAVTQIQTTYAAQIQNRDARAQALQAELQTLGTAVQTEQARSPQNATALQAAITAYRTRQQSAQQEMQTLTQPIELAVTYVREQITLQLSQAVRDAAAARGVTMLVNSESVVWRAETADITSAVVTELNRLVPSVQIVPPQGYEPGMLLRAQQNNAANPAATTPAAAPQTR